MRRRDLLLSTAALGVLPAPALAVEAVDPEAVRERVARLRERMAKAGQRTVARYQRQLAAGVVLPETLWTVIREGFGAFSVVPSLRRMSQEEQQLPQVQALLLEVAEKTGTYLLHLHAALGGILADPLHRATAGAALHRLRDQEEDDEFGRSALLSLRSERQAIHAHLQEHGADHLLERAYADLDLVVTTAQRQQEEESGAPRETVGRTMARGLATLVGVALLGAAALGAFWVIGSIYATFVQPICLPLWVLTAVLGGLLMMTAGAAGLGMIAAGRPVGPIKSLDGKRITINAVASWKWFSTGAEFGENQPKLTVEGTVRVPARLTGVGPEGLPGSIADGTSPAPGLPEYALVARVGDWTGLLTGEGDILTSARRTGELWLAVNVPEAKAKTTDGVFRVVVYLYEKSAVSLP